MAKRSSIEKNKYKAELIKKYKAQRDRLKKAIYSKEMSSEDRFKTVIRLASLPRNGAASRFRNRCELTGRPRGVYRKLKMSRIALRTMASEGLIPGMTKSSW